MHSTKVGNVGIFVQLQMENKFVIVISWIHFDANLHLAWYFVSKYVWLTTVSNLIFKFK